MSETPTLDLNQAIDLSALMHKKAEEKAKQLPRLLQRYNKVPDGTLV